MYEKQHCVDNIIEKVNEGQAIVPEVRSMEHTVIRGYDVVVQLHRGHWQLHNLLTFQGNLWTCGM